MDDGAVSGRRHGDLARIGRGVGDELGNGRHRNRGVHHHQVGLAADARDWGDIADKIVVEMLVERDVDRLRRTDQEQRVAVCWRMGDRFGADITAGTRPIVDDE